MVLIGFAADICRAFKLFIRTNLEINPTNCRIKKNCLRKYIKTSKLTRFWEIVT